jgi:UDP-GlcNAc:undecaprenyl-phosphate GlcNAc-1-phosphate transferase
MRNVLYIFVFGQTFIISFLLMPLVIRFALRRSVVDLPGDRKVHHTAKPLMGGVGIFLSFFLVVAGNLAGFFAFYRAIWFERTLPGLADLFPHLGSVLPDLLLIFAGGILIHALGLLDDIFKGKLTYRTKFIAQFVIILLVAVGGVRVDFMPNTILNILVTTLWIVGMTNSFNLLDNMDGLTAGVSIISALLLFCVAVLQGQIFFAFILASLAGACLGFLLYNFYPSKVFMGDSGSLFLGYMFGALTVTGSYVIKESASLLPVLIPVLILSIPLYDTFSVMFIRWREGRHLFVGDKKHFSHRLVDLGMSQRSAVVFIYLVGFCVGIAAILLPYVSVGASILVLMQAITIYTLITILIIIGGQNRNVMKKRKTPEKDL